MTLRATQRWLGHRSLTNTAAPAGPGDLSTISGGSERYRLGSVDQTLDRVALSPPLDRTFCPLLDTISFAEPVRGAHPPTGRARTKAPAVRWGFRFVIFPANAGWRVSSKNVVLATPRARRVLRVARPTSATSPMSGLRDRWSRGTIPYPPTPHHDRAKADNDRDQDRQDGNSCIILTLPVAEWVSWCATGFERHNSSDRKLRHAAVSHTRTAKGRNSGHHPRWMTGVDRRGCLPLAGWANDLQVAVCGGLWGGDVTGALPNYLTGSNDPSYEATCQSGYGAVCKTVYPGSIPGVASIEDRPCLKERFASARHRSSPLGVSYFKR